jgi:5'-deoxynucleotidase YfbR-like HD superfamily hydrolase
MIDEFLSLSVINDLKAVEREKHVGNRKESPAEHTWAMLIIADWLNTKITEPVDRLELFELIIYHDLPEAIAGDISLTPGNDRTSKEAEERAAMESLAQRLPPSIGMRLERSWNRFEKRSDRSAQLAKLADVLEAQLFFLEEPDGWTGWSEAYFRSVIDRAAAPFPELGGFLESFYDHVREEGLYDE